MRNKLPGKIIYWNITKKCNYKCSYCTAKKILCDYEERDSDAKKIINEFKNKLVGKWTFVLGGSGEPFMKKDLFEISRCLIKLGHRVCIVTNFSLPVDKYLEFCKLFGKNITWFHVGLHLEYVSLNDFIEKSIKVIKKIGKQKFMVRTVGRKGELIKLKTIGKKFGKLGINFIIQPEKININTKKIFVNYSKFELEIIKDFYPYHNFVYENTKYKGNYCWTGCRSFIIDKTGEVWRCNQAKKIKNNINGYLGNIIFGPLKLKEGPSICIYEMCRCIDPIANNMIIK